MVCTGSERVGPRHHRGTAVEHYAGIDVSLERSGVCVVDATGRIIREAKVASEPEALVDFFRRLGLSLTRVGLEAGPLSQWLHAGLAEAGFETVLLETRHVKAALSAMTVKTDRKDARGLAQLLRMGWFQRVHADRPAGDAPSRVTNDPALTGGGARAKSDVADPRRHDHHAADATHVKPMTA